MHLFFLAAGVLLLAALLLTYLTAARRRPEPRPLRAPELSPQAGSSPAGNWTVRNPGPPRSGCAISWARGDRKSTRLNSSHWS